MGIWDNTKILKMEMCEFNDNEKIQIAEGTISLTIQVDTYSYNEYKAYVFFDNNSDECCKIELEKTNKAPLKYKKKDLEYIKKMKREICEINLN